MMLGKVIAIIVLSLFIFAFTACEKKGTAEKAGEKVDQAVEKIGEKIEDAKEAISDNAEKAGEEIDQAAEKAGEKIEDAKEAIGDKAEQTGEYMNDATITAKVKADIFRDPLLKSLQINVITTKGVVTLSGVVDSQQSIGRVMEIAQSVKEVKSVENDLVVKGS